MAKLFKNWTKQAKLVAWFESKGYSVVPCRTSKYIAMRKDNQDRTFFLGKAGAVRCSNHGIISDSTSVGIEESGFRSFCMLMATNEKEA